MSGFRAPGEDEYDESQFLPASPDTYRVAIRKYEVKTGIDSQSKYNPDGDPRVWFYLEPLFIEGDEDAMMVDTDDKQLPDDKYVIFFFDPDHLGIKPVVAKSRKFLASALAVPVEQPVEANSLEEFCDSLIDRELTVDISVTSKGYNNVDDSRPVQKKTRKRKSKGEDLVEVAAEVFSDETESEDPF